MSKTERALLATDQQGTLIVLTTDGSSIAFDCEEVSRHADDIGLHSGGGLECGLYLWEGTARTENLGHPLDPIEPGVVYTGALRPVADWEELQALLAMEPPEV